MSPSDRYQQHLNRVSRSFAFCIARLENPLRSWVGLTYLICRLLDTVEDITWADSETQKHQFRQFDRFLMDPAALQGLQQWQRTFPHDTLPKGESLLIGDAQQIFADLHGLPDSVKVVVQEMVGSMSRGMQHFAANAERGQLRLRNLTEVNQYCFFVAGIVGEALARFVALVEPRFQARDSRILDAHHFGLFLQKVNLLKDFWTDLKEGRHLIPSRQEVLVSVARNARGALRFLQDLPVEQRGFRLFCGWSLFLGLATLRWTERAYRKGKSAKVPKWQAVELVARTESFIDDNSAVHGYFEKLWGETGLNLAMRDERSGDADPATDSGLVWLTELYRGQLRLSELSELGLAVR